MEYQIVIKKRFANDLLKLLQYLEEEWGKQVAGEFYERINKVYTILRTHPHVGALSTKISGLRGLSVTHHNRLFYRVHKNTVIIISLSDTRKKSY